MDQSTITASHESQTDLEGSLQQLKLQDCAYFLRTGTCAFGSKCRYNHPTVEPSQAFSLKGNAENLPERLGQTECQFFMKTGVCKFGPACWYHHPRPNSGTNSSEQLQLNFLGLPLRPSEKECAYYLQTGSCKYGNTCKFHHPQPTAADSTPPSSKSPIHISNGASMPTPLAYKEPGYAWRVDGTSFVPFNVGIPSPLSVAMVTSSPQSPLSVAMVTSSPQHVQGSELKFSQSHEHTTTGIRFPRPMATILHGQPIFPDRPGQPDCHHYMKTGDCKFGMNCKYHHPKDRSMSLPCGLNPMGLPLRPGNQACPYYVKHGICKFGPVCKFDHPVNVLPHSPPYSPSTSSLNEVPVAPFLPDSSLPVSLRSAVSEGLQHSVSDNQVTLKESITMPSI